MHFDDTSLRIARTLAGEPPDSLRRLHRQIQVDMERGTMTFNLGLATLMAIESLVKDVALVTERRALMDRMVC